MNRLLIIGGIALIIPLAWDYASNAVFSASSGQTILPTFSGSQDIASWEPILATVGFVLFWLGIIMVSNLL